MNTKYLSSFLLSALVAMFIGCGGGGGGTSGSGNGDGGSSDPTGNQNNILKTANNNFNTAQGWGFIDYRGYGLEDPVKPEFYDPNISHTNDGSGSAYLSHSGTKENRNDRLYSDFAIPVTPGKRYTLSFWMMTKDWPSSTIQPFGAFLSENGTEIENSFGSRTSNSKKDAWEQTFILIEVPDNPEIKYFQIRVAMNLNDISTKVWVDDFALTEGITLPARPQKEAKNGSITTVDAIGNFKVNGQDFFPLGIFGDKNRADWSIYKNQGFNTYMWVSNKTELEKADAAGLKSAMQVVQYITDTNFGQKLTSLSNDLDNLYASGSANSLIMYYVDNEFFHLKNDVSDALNTIQQKDNNKRPIYMLNGDYALARKYNDLIDVTGAYAAKDGTQTPTPLELLYQDREPNQKSPSAFAQINAGVGNNFKAVLFGAIAQGARAAAFWKDGGTAGSIENRSWWNQLPTIKNQIDQLMDAGIIQADHTLFSAYADNPALITGTRLVNGTGYLIVANPTDSDITTTFNVKNLGYTPSSVVDFFTNTPFTAIGAHDATVIKLVK
jgi:hypothetical protein